jgi:hypothetical protein
VVITERGLTFGFFPWYRPIVNGTIWTSPPDLPALSNETWYLESPGTCSPAHFRRIGFTRVGGFDVDVAKLHQRYPGLRPGDSQAIQDITIANRLNSHRAAALSGSRSQSRTLTIDDLRA